jgi:hypothetical protein
MKGKDNKERMNTQDEAAGEPSTETHSGMPNPVDPNTARSTEHKSGYGGEGGEPRTSSDDRGKTGA